MRINLISAVIVFIALQVKAADGFGQDRITLREHNAPLTKVLEDLRKLTGMYYAIQSENSTATRPVNLSVKDATLVEVLDLTFQGQPVTYQIVDKIIVVKKREAENVVSTPLADSTHLKMVKVQGLVLNEQGQPLAGATVMIRQLQKGTVTNARGEFDLGEIPSGSTLLVTFVGYAPEQITVKEAGNLRLFLKVASNELDKVVIQAYGLTTQRLQTGSIATVSAAEIERQPTMNPLTALEGQVPGLVLTQDNGYASAPFKIEIRGRSVINDNIPSEPLFIIDGVPLTIVETGNTGGYGSGSGGIIQNGLVGPASGQSPLFSINPEDIESMSVLKDADATAIYGSRGANGVIIITTKKGKPGKAKLDMNVYQGESAVSQRFPMMNLSQYLTMRGEALKNDNLAPTISNAYDLLNWDTARATNWQNAIWGNMGHTTDVQADITGGDVQNTFRLAGAYHRQTSILTHSGADQRGSVDFNLIHKSVNQRLTFSFTSLYSFTQSNLVFNSNAVAIAPDAPAFFTSMGVLNWNGWGLKDNLLAGYAGNLLNTYVAKTALLNSTMKLQYEIVRGLSATVQLGYETSHNNQAAAQPIAAQNPMISPFGSAQFGNNDQSSTIVEPQLVYDGRISKGKLEALIGGTYQGAVVDGNELLGTGYSNDNLLGSIGNAGTKGAFDDYGQYHYVAGFGRLNYNWEDRYIMNLTARRDGSSRFGPGRQFGNFGAVGGAWIFTEEGWFKDHVKVLSFGKVRGSYGITGIDEISNYQFMNLWSGENQFSYNGSNPLSPTQIGNPNLQWQTNKKLEGAIDLGFLKDRFTVEVARYQNRSSNQLITYGLPYLTGFTGVTANLPADVQNMGWESTVRAKMIDHANFTWSANFNIGINRNKLLAFPGLAESPYSGTYIIGQSLNIQNFLHFTGVDPLTGQYTFQDRNHNGQIDPYIINGSSNDLYPKDMSVKFDGGFGTNVRYKSWELVLFCHFRNQTVPAALSTYPGTVNSNQSTLQLDRWQRPGDHAKFARYTTKPTLNDDYFYSYSDGILSNGSYIRFQNISLTYDFPKSWMRKVGLQGGRIYVRAQNLFVLTKYEGVDPDTPSFADLPPAKTVVGGIQFTF